MYSQFSRGKLFSKEFAQFCQEKFADDVQKLEEERTKTQNIVKIRRRVIYVAWIILFVIFFATLFINFISYSSEIDLFFQKSAFFNLLMIKIVFFVQISFVFLVILNLPSIGYSSKVKKVILPKLFAFVGDFKYIEQKNHKEREEIRDYVENLKIFNKFDFFSCDDAFKGIYNGIEISVSEIKLSKSSGKNSKTIFEGILISFPSFRDFQSNTIVKCVDDYFEYCTPKVNLEDPEFKKLYNVYCHNQVEARIFLTPAFMVRIVEYAQKRKEKIAVSIENNQINIAIHTKKDWFYVPVDKSISSLDIYRGIIFDLFDILKIIEALKLDEI